MSEEREARHYEADCWLQIQRRERMWRKGEWKGPISVARLTQDMPEQLLPSAVLIKLRVRIPVEAFDPLITAVVDVPIDHVLTQVEAKVVEP